MLNSLHVSQSGLNAAKTQVENVSNNIANENTPGYKKRVVDVTENAQLDSSVTGSGVSANSTYRIISEFMNNNILNENSKLEHYDKLSTTLESIETIFTETDNSGLSADLNRYFQAIEDLRSNPNSEVFKTNAKNQGTILVNSLKNIYEGIETVERLERNDLENNVDNVNNILKEIGNINDKMSRYSGMSNDLLDKRDRLEKELSEYVKIDVKVENGIYQLKIAGEIAIGQNVNVREVKVSEDLTSQKDKFTLTDSNNNFVDSIKNIQDPSTGVITPRALDNEDKVTYKLENGMEVSVTIGEVVKDSLGNNVDLNGDGDNTNDTVTSANVTRALVYKINSDSSMSSMVQAYNGDYATDSNGNKLTNDTQDNYLVIEAKIPGTDGKFDGRISIVEQTDATDPSTITSRESIEITEEDSKEAVDRVFISLFDKELFLSTGALKAQTDNLTSDSYNNKIQGYKDKLDNLAKSLSDLTDSYIKTGIDEYVYGDKATDSTLGSESILNLFSGNSVETLVFNANNVNDLDQRDLDYLGTLQWKKDIPFGEDQKESSFLEFFQEIKVNVSEDKENNDFLLKTQKDIINSLENTYDQITKVDKDEEMLNLVKFQSAYTANAKIVTTIDEMIQVLLGLKR
ncbi:MAG: flagellar hook-associated protein FlgK [Poseidonibacter sp.]|uniref:flagellar hook-associated protein FlgK n=1 Tax=Poseidonibacter sp. TaxID=2321188 RepID=UPI00359DE97D